MKEFFNDVRNKESFSSLQNRRDYYEYYFHDYLCVLEDAINNMEKRPKRRSDYLSSSQENLVGAYKLLQSVPFLESILDKDAFKLLLQSQAIVDAFNFHNVSNDFRKPIINQILDIANGPFDKHESICI
jgi:hypothetical protein